MYGTIIVPVDLTNTEKAAVMLETAQRLGGENAKIVLVNILEAIPNYVAVQIPKDFRDQAVADAKDELTTIANSTTLQTEIEVRSGVRRQGFPDI